MVDLSQAPFHLDAEAIAWVERTIDSLTPEEKIGQLFINLNVSFDEGYLDSVISRGVGGIRFMGADSATVQQHIRYAQSNSKVPLLVASNPEMGGAGSINDGTLVTTHLGAGSSPDPDDAYRLGLVGGRETAAIGCNWAFAPIVDIHRNWRNTVISTRSFGDNADIVIERAKRYFDGLSETGSAAAMKHFPGDGIDERDQHVVTTYNTLGYDEWNETYGRVYRELIAHGVQSIMIGHIGAPALSKHFRPEMTDAEVLPATLAPELLQDLLRGELGFNGLILTDASSMIGMTQAMKRSDAVPAAIAAGCDMFLFFRNPDEDLEYLRRGIESGVVTQERLHEALTRILGLKASLGLHTTPRDQLVPPVEALSVIGSDEHHAIAAEVSDRVVTLIKDTEGNLPLRPETHRRIRLYGITGHSDFTGTDPSGYLDVAREELERAGFEVHVFKNALQRQAEGEEGVYFHTVMLDEASAAYPEKYDAAIVFANVAGFAQEATVRIRWSTPMAAEIPWYVTEVPTVFVSLQQPNHLVDVPMVKTMIHAHSPSREAIHAAVDKITGASAFTGTFNDNVWCGEIWGTRL
ncbi:MAG: glycosyl hydrolase [Microbacterium sp. SCN 70-200]|uniref:glycoside hydrolase family 3 protein n=1 Tax=unclassified Microbacterium TaxID=2609290 RepID=UPI00086BB948|nr:MULTISPECIES: glycoside hydrolase family 3 N-terminal domain-containing protein [unclassified Microbacterium]ODT40503.1 MAG: glycosyl hydrolase [Microbacterium sp. SCN 70-200]OJV85027.1 MAG: glycosyl hydrolase [Microbacterium sp. 70-16]